MKKIDPLLVTVVVCLVFVITTAVFAIYADTKRRTNASKACEALNGRIVHFHKSPSLCFVDGKLVKVSN